MGVMTRRILAVLMLLACWLLAGALGGPARANAAEGTVASAAPAPSASPSSGRAGGLLESAAAALKTQDVYVAPGAPSVDETRLRRAMSALPGPPIKVAVLPASAASEVDGNAAALPGQISFLIGQGGTVVVLAGQQMLAASTVVNGADLDSALAAAGRAPPRRTRKRGPTRCCRWPSRAAPADWASGKHRPLRPERAPREAG